MFTWFLVLSAKDATLLLLRVIPAEAMPPSLVMLSIGPTPTKATPFFIGVVLCLKFQPTPCILPKCQSAFWVLAIP